jgi:methylglutamate dehydrogenase subunit B
MRLPCPFCGMRDQSEFRYRGDAGITRPAADQPDEAFIAYVYQRENPAGPHPEWWQHVMGCRAVFRLTRDTRTHIITAEST